MLNINSIQKEIIELNELYELKIKAFHLIRDEKYKEAKKILENNSEVFSYFIQFKDGRGLPAIIRFSLGTSWELHYDLHYESVMLQDLRRFKKEIEEKTERYEKLVFIEQQKDFITLQKINLIETEKDRKSSLSFTFILAFGVFVSMIFSLYQIFIDFQNSSTFHRLVLSRVFIIIFTMMIQFTLTHFNMEIQLKKYFLDQGFVVVVCIVILILSLMSSFIFPDFSLTESSNNEIISVELEKGQTAQQNIGDFEEVRNSIYLIAAINST